MNSVVIYPSAISRACAALDEAPAFLCMPDGFFRVIVRIIKKINISAPNSPIFASRGKLSEESGKSLEVVGRAIRWLEEQGLVQRTQKARAGLRGSSSPLVPTQALLDALQLTQSHVPRDPPPSTAMPSYAQTPVETDGSISSSLDNLSENNPAAPGVFVKTQGVKIPADLTGLVRQGLSAFGVLALMKQAGQAKQRLSDVVAACRKNLTGLQGRDLYAYLRALLARDRDFAGQVREDAQELKAQQVRELIARKAEELLGRRYVTQDGRVEVTVEAGGMLSELRDGVRFGRPLGQAFLDALADGRLVPLR